MINNIFSNININRINFTGIKTAQIPRFTETKDTFTSSSENLSFQIEAKINEAKEELKQSEEVFPFQTEEYLDAKRRFHIAIDVSVHSKGTTEEEKKEKELRAVQKEYNKKAAIYNATKKKITALQTRIKELEIYKKQNEIHPKTAFLYDPDTRAYDKHIKAAATDGMADTYDLARSLGIPDEIFDDFIKTGRLTVDTVGEKSLKRTYIDKTYPQNKEFLDKLKEKAPDVLSAGQFAFDYNFTQSQIETALKSGRLTPFLSDKHSGLSFLIDTKDEINAKTINEHIKLTPVPFKKYYSGALHYGAPIPVQKLEKLGFENAKTLALYVKNGTLKGSITPVELKDGKKGYKVAVDTNSKSNEAVLRDLRSKNQKTISTKQFAQMTEMKPSELKEALLNGEVEIIPEYIFEFDHSSVYIDLNNEKNAEFLEKKLFEKELEAELTAKKKEERNTIFGLTTKLARKMCPKTKEAGSKFAAYHPEVIQLFEKIEQEGRDSLTEDEEKLLKMYYKSIWTEAGTEEFKAGIKAAKEMIANYQKGETSEIPASYLELIQNYSLNK